MKNSWGENRGGTPTVVRLTFEARPCPSARQKTHCVCRRFASEFSFVRSFPFVLHAEAASCECFHRHFAAAAQHGALNQIGGDGSKQWRVIARMRSRIARTRLFDLRSVILRWPRSGPRRMSATKSAVADLENHDPKSETRFRLAVALRGSRSLSSGRPLRAGPVGSLLRVTEKRAQGGTAASPLSRPHQSH